MKKQSRSILLYGVGFLLPICLILGYQSYKHGEYLLTSDFEENDKICVVYTPQPYVIELITTLSQYEMVGVFLTDDSYFEEATRNLSRANKDNIRYATVPKVDQWVRDSGPGILKNGLGQLRAIDFYSPKNVFDHNAKAIAKGLGLPTSNSEVPILGGARESNGEGLLITTEQYFDFVRKGNWTKRQIEQKMREEFGVKQVLWLKEGLVEDQPFNSGSIHDDLYPFGSGAHVDEFCRFINRNTVLLAKVDSAVIAKHPLYKINQQRLEENFKRLQAWKKPKLQIIRIPAAELNFDEVDHPVDNQSYKVVLPSSYLNFVIGNKVVIAARYYRPGLPESVRVKDEQVREILQACFPQHQIVQLDPGDLNRRGGGFHCVTFNLPTKKKQKRRWRWG